MQSTIFALVAFVVLLASVQCDDNKDKDVSEYIIKQSFHDLLRTYEVKSETNAPQHFTIRNEALTIGTKLHLMEDGHERYIADHKLSNIMSTWVITAPGTNKELGTIENKLKFVGSMMTATGAFGNYKIEGDFGNRSFSIFKDGQKVATIEKKSFHLRDTYGLSVYGNADRALMVLFTVIVNEIREH